MYTVLQPNNVQFHTIVASVPCTQQILSVFTLWLYVYPAHNKSNYV